MVSVLGGLVLVTAEPAAACSCVDLGSDAAKAAHADAVFVGTLISQATQIDPHVERAQREFTRTSDRRVRRCWASRSAGFRTEEFLDELRQSRISIG